MNPNPLLNPLTAWMAPLAIVALAWSLPWKGYALWKAARAGSKPWFVVLLLVNTMAVLDIIYIYVISKPAKPSDAPKQP